MSHLIIQNAATVVSPKPHQLTGSGLEDLQIISDGWIYVKNGEIFQVGTQQQVEPLVEGNPEVIDATNKTVLPGLVDSHTHLVFGGSREQEFEDRARGLSYEAIAKRGGGIVNTVRATRAASFDTLIERGMQYLDDAMKLGTTTLEVKSGYGLELETEIRILQVIQHLNQHHPLDLIPTFLGAHAFPPGKTAVEYTEEVLAMLPHVMEYAEFCDVFCERDYFNLEQAERIGREANRLGMRLRMHVNQFYSIGGVELAQKLDCVSIDHLEVLSDRDLEHLKEKPLCTTMLPGVSLYLGLPYAKARDLIQTGSIPVLASDFNPGSCMCLSLPLMMTLACTQMRMSPAECLCACTQNAAYSLGIQHVGTLTPGSQADLILCNTTDYRTLMYYFGTNHVQTVIKRGKRVWN